MQGVGQTGQVSGSGQGLVIVATLLCSTMRGARLQESKARLQTLKSTNPKPYKP